ncbi:RNA-guided endonuclease TnpB family protein [Nostoc sp.]
MVKEPSGYYLQVCVNAPEVELKASDACGGKLRAVGIDPGLKSVITTDAGREVKPPKLYRNQQAKLRRLQRKLARQQKDSSNSKKTKHLIALLHEKIRRSRNAFNHKLSTKIVCEYGAVAMEDLQIKNLTRKPKARPQESGLGYEQNGAKRKAGLNKSFADSALGDLISKIETKSKAAGREFVRVAAHYTTINCSQCGEKIKKSLSVRTHRCTCGYVAGRDENAAQNILLKGCELFKQTYRSWEWKRDANLKPVSASLTEGQQEAVQTAPSSEYDDRSRERGIQAPFAPQTSPNPLTTALSLDEPPSPTCVPCNINFSSDLPSSSSGRKKKKRKPAQTQDESFRQLTLWDWASEIGCGG